MASIVLLKRTDHKSNNYVTPLFQEVANSALGHLVSCAVACLVRGAAKAERLRQAKADAEREIAQYRAEREGAYQKKLSEV